jgi:hypothetical protein
VQLSTSQWVAFLTALPAAVTYGIYFKAAQAHPESALALNLEEFYKLHPEQAPGAAEEVPASAAEVKKETAKEEPAPPASPREPPADAAADEASAVPKEQT